jgi:hypothetical protein
MTMIVEWDNDEKTILCLRYEAKWDWDDFNTAERAMHAMLSTVDHRVDLVFDVRSGSFPPPGAMSRFRDVTDNPHPNVRHLVFVGPVLLMRFVQSLIRIMGSLYGSGFNPPAFSFAESMTEARAVLKSKTDATLIGS